MESRQPGVASLDEKRCAEALRTLNYCRQIANFGIRRTLEEGRGKGRYVDSP